MAFFGFDSPSLAGPRRVWVVGIDHARRFSLDGLFNSGVVARGKMHRVAHGTAAMLCPKPCLTLEC